MHLYTYYPKHKNHGSTASSRLLSLPFQHETPRPFPPDESRPYHLRWSLSGTPPGRVSLRKKRVESSYKYPTIMALYQL